MNNDKQNAIGYRQATRACWVQKPASTINSVIMSVFEHQRLLAHDFAYNTDFEWLLTQEFAVFTISRQRGQWQLKVGHYIGVIILPSGITLEILPKTIAATQKPQSYNGSAFEYQELLRTRQWVQLMLSNLMQDHHSSGRKLPSIKSLGQLSQDLTPLTPLFTQILPLSQWLVLQFLQLLSAYQPTKHYETQNRNQAGLQGKLLIKEQLRHNSYQPHRFACEVNQLSVQLLCNRIIKSALKVIQPLANPYPKADDIQALRLSAAMRTSMIPWQAVAALSPHELQRVTPLYLQAKRQLDLQPMAKPRLRAAQHLLDLAYWLLQMQQSRVSAGNSVSANQHSTQARLCLLINMNQAFEQWASGQVAALFDPSTTTNTSARARQMSFSGLLYNKKAKYQIFYQPQQVWLSDPSGQTCLTMRPDLLLYKITDTVRSCSHVIDIKWKPLPHTRDISASDAYQLTSYAQAYQAEQVWLIYPVTDVTRQPVALRSPKAAHSHFSESEQATLWLIPFNVTTGTLNLNSSTS